MPLAYSIERDGFGIHEAVLPLNEVHHLIDLLPSEADAKRGGIRDVMSHVPALRAVADALQIVELARKALGATPRVVRATLFDKTPASNWKVPWHQDVTIAVKSRTDVAGYGPWSAKAGVVHVQPPASVLEQMISIRIHLDDCPAENGALKVIAGSHSSGKIAERNIPAWISSHPECICAVQAGGALIMRPLLLHASSASAMPGHRRVLHFDYAGKECLSPELEWALV